ncbi:hypothetical protein [Streptomyces sp. DW26H14]|uniref:hypothetical protein n=1 Tax=Streptomyces sp. DW26H14 TaxID=3435395 RepID=UPI00403DCE32
MVAEDGRLAGVEFADGGLVPYGALFAATARRQASPLPALLVDAEAEEWAAQPR